MNTTTKSKFKWGLMAVFAMLAVIFGSHSHHDHGVAMASASGAAAVPEEIVKSLKDIQDANAQLLKDYNEQKKELAALKTAGDELKKQFDDANEHLNKMRKAGLAQPVTKLAHQAVTDDCAKFIAAIAICGAEKHGKLDHIKGVVRESLIAECKSILGMEAKSALTSSDIPLPTQYGAQVVELVWKYGQARQSATVYPLGAGTVKLPKLATSPAFGFINQSATVTEKSPQVSFVTFGPAKAGGLVRIPSELDADSIVPLGQFLARYIARETAKWEDTCLFLGDGTSTYNSISGIGKFAVTNNSGACSVTLASTKTHVTDIALADIRTLRTKVNAAALTTSCYYAHPTMEALFVSFNTSATVVPFVRNADGSATFDGYPIKWVGVMMPYDAAAHTGGGFYPLMFGDVSYWYFGERTGISVETSRDVFFATDELALRALERFDIQAMANDATAALTLASS